MENSMEVPKKIKIEWRYDTAIPLLGVYPKEFKAGAQRYLHTHVHCSITHNNQDTSISRWMDK